MTKKEFENKLIIIVLLATAAGGLAIIGCFLGAISSVLPPNPTGWILAGVFIVASLVVGWFADRRRNELADKILTSNFQYLDVNLNQ